MVRARHLILLAAALAGTAQARTVEDEQLWFAATLLGNAGRFAYSIDVQPRFYDKAGRLGQLLFRPAFGWRVSDDVTLFAGYAHAVLPDAARSDANEDRLFGQMIWSVGMIGRGQMLARTRLERRDLSTGREAGWRARQFVRYVRPLGDPRRTRALVSAEAFVNLNDTDWGARAGFDQLRSFVGVEVPVGTRNTLEIGYLNQRINARAGVIRSNHIASLGVVIRP